MGDWGPGMGKLAPLWIVRQGTTTVRLRAPDFGEAAQLAASRHHMRNPSAVVLDTLPDAERHAAQCVAALASRFGKVAK